MGKYYDFNNLLSRNCLINVVIGIRGGGKSYDAKKRCIKNAINKGQQFVYVRRYKSDLKLSVKTFFNDVGKEFPEHEFKTMGNTFICDNKVIGYAVPLSTANNVKSAIFNDVTTIFFDEFLISTKGASAQRYLPEEVPLFLGLMETIIRERDNVRVLMVGNSFSTINPYFTYFKVSPRKNSIVKYDDYIAIELYTNEVFKEGKLQTRLGRLVNGTELGSQILDNEFYEDNEVFIEKRPADANFDFAFAYKGKTFGFWYSLKQGKLYMSKAYNPESTAIFSLTTEDHQPNLLYIKGSVRPPAIVKVRKAYQLGILYFDTQDVKKAGEEILQIIY